MDCYWVALHSDITSGCLRDHMDRQGLNPSQLCAKQVPYLHSCPKPYNFLKKGDQSDNKVFRMHFLKRAPSGLIPKPHNSPRQLLGVTLEALQALKKWPRLSQNHRAQLESHFQTLALNHWHSWLEYHRRQKGSPGLLSTVGRSASPANNNNVLKSSLHIKKSQALSLLLCLWYYK